MNTDKSSINNTNSYKKIGLFMLLCAIAGAVLGSISMLILDGRTDNIESGATTFMTYLQQLMLPLLSILTLLTIISGEYNIRRMKTNCKKLLEAEDEECDRWDYEEERIGAWGMVINILSQVLSVLILSAGYSVRYISDGHHQNVLASCLVFLGCYAYNGFWQARFVKVVQSVHPEKKGDVSSRKFQQQWLESCDEAEREVIYQSAYNTYVQISRWIPVLLVITMLGHLFFNTGIMAIVIVAVIWLVVTVSYLRSCVKLKGAKLRE